APPRRRAGHRCFSPRFSWIISLACEPLIFGIHLPEMPARPDVDSWLWGHLIAHLPGKEKPWGPMAGKERQSVQPRGRNALQAEGSETLRAPAERRKCKLSQAQLLQLVSIPPAQAQFRPVAQDHHVVAVKHGLQFLDPLDVHHGRAADADELLVV